MQVDAADFALAKLEVQPARNPSFWISRTFIHDAYTKIDGFWLSKYVKPVMTAACRRLTLDCPMICTSEIVRACFINSASA
jgi:hypothetical protein